jgi:hypothetical protein
VCEAVDERRSGSCTTTANALVPCGTPDHSSAGATFSPSLVWRCGIGSWLENAGLRSARCPRVSF